MDGLRSRLADRITDFSHAKMNIIDDNVDQPTRCALLC